MQGAHLAADLGKKQIGSHLRSRSDLLLENLALRQQLAVLSCRQPRRRMAASGRLFWMTLRRLWPKWKRVLVLGTASVSVLSGDGARGLEQGSTGQATGSQSGRR